MARTDVPYYSLSLTEGITLTTTPVTMDATNGHNIVVPRVSTPGAADNIDRLFLAVTNTAGSDKTLTIKNGVAGTVGARGGTGDKVITVTTAAGGGMIGPLDAARFAQTDGSINIDLQAGHTGTITAFMIPRW